MVFYWVFEKGSEVGVIVIEKCDGKSYVDIKDYEKMRVLFGDFLKEV